ncbi:hypothetical protein SRIMR7_39810 [Streptomyces rimosus subsp. rimosus]|uniref:Uncharacterized protein n=1 Tax=Streptomyces rimosus subsp. rimosus TaxID=132474 RepID=A0ABY3ZDD8_STRRM|nr:hypothetical protein SRIMR7_39810 [Streptomyces rimosus subsp. rimosus]
MAGAGPHENGVVRPRKNIREIPPRWGTPDPLRSFNWMRPRVIPRARGLTSYLGNAPRPCLTRPAAPAPPR